MGITLTKFEDSIKKFLDQLAEEDELFAKTYQKPNKSIKECCQYIYKEVEKNRNGGNCVACEDDEIYGLAIHYYDEDDIKVEDTKTQVKEVAHVDTPAPKTEKKKRTPKAKTVDEDVPEALVIPLF